MGDEIEEIRTRWRAVGDAHEQGREINPLDLLLTYAADTRALLDVLAASEARAASAEAENQRLTDALAGIQFDLINCHQAAGRNACEHIKDAIVIVNRALLAQPSAVVPDA